jgi:hypothetical protein
VIDVKIEKVRSEKSRLTRGISNFGVMAVRFGASGIFHQRHIKAKDQTIDRAILTSLLKDCNQKALLAIGSTAVLLTE